MNKVRLFAALAVLLAAPVLGAQQQYGRDSDTWKWDGRVDAGHWMNVFNVNGTVDFAPSPDNMVHLVAEKRSNGREMDDIHFEVVQADGNVTICAIWNNSARCEDGGVESFHHNGNNENHSNVKITGPVVLRTMTPPFTELARTSDPTSRTETPPFTECAPTLTERGTLTVILTFE